jgi:FkbM family methyltransferase
MLTLRDIGVYASSLIPFLRAPGKWIYLRLPRYLHDTPTSWLEARFGKESEIRFIQAGAFDGIAGDPIRALILAHPDWRGALAEPMVNVFAQLKNNYAAVNGRLNFFNCAVSDRHGTIEMYQISESEIERLHLPPWSREVASVSASHIKKHFPTVHLSRHTVPTMRICDIAKACGFTKVDLLILDVEGHERRIIDDIEFASLGVRAVMFEHKHMTTRDEEAVLDHFRAFGFMIKRYGRDTVAYR